MDELINSIDILINKESRRLSQDEVEQLLILQNNLFDISVKQQEDNDIAKMHHENTRGEQALLMKAETTQETDKKGEIKLKNKYTDTTLEYALDNMYQKEIEGFIVNKYKFKLVENKIRLLNEKLMLAKKYLIPTN